MKYNYDNNALIRAFQNCNHDNIVKAINDYKKQLEENDKRDEKVFKALKDTLDAMESLNELSNEERSSFANYMILVLSGLEILNK